MLRPVRGNLMEDPEDGFDLRRDIGGDKNIPTTVGDMGHFAWGLVDRPSKKFPIFKRDTHRGGFRHYLRQGYAELSKGEPARPRLAAAGKAGIMAAGAALANVSRGYSDRASLHKHMDSYQQAERELKSMESEAPESTPNTKKRASDVAPSTSTAVDKKSTPPSGKLKPNGGGVNKAPKPQTSEGPKKGLQAPKKPAGPSCSKGSAQAQEVQPPSPEQMLQNRAGEFRQRLSAISMVQNGRPAASPAPSAPRTQTAKESATVGFLRGVLREARLKNAPPKLHRVRQNGGEEVPIHNGVSEAKMRKLLKSNANIRARLGTNVKHTFLSNDGQHAFSGRPLAMRQKIISEHRRKNFALPNEFENFSPVQVGEYFDRLSDQGMLEDRPNLDTSSVNYWKRRTGRVGKRVVNKAKDFLGGVVSIFRSKSEQKNESKKQRESSTGQTEKTADFCSFAVGNVSSPSECGCSECSTLVETAASSFGQLSRGDTTPTTSTTEDPEKKKLAIMGLLRKRKNKRRTVRENDQKDYIRRELMLHAGTKPAKSPLQQGFFDTYNAFRKVDRLGMNLATTAIILNNMPRTRARVLQTLSHYGPQATEGLKKAWTALRTLLSGYKFRENDDYASPWGEEARAGFANPVGWAKDQVKKHIGQGVYRLGKRLNSKTIQAAALPLSHLGGHAVTGAAIYAGKKLIYDPLSRKVHELGQRVEKMRPKKSGEQSEG